MKTFNLINYGTYLSYINWAFNEGLLRCSRQKESKSASMGIISLLFRHLCGDRDWVATTCGLAKKQFGIKSDKNKILIISRKHVYCYPVYFIWLEKSKCIKL